jgi:hypothetical protein
MLNKKRPTFPYLTAQRYTLKSKDTTILQNIFHIFYIGQKKGAKDLTLALL